MRQPSNRLLPKGCAARLVVFFAALLPGCDAHPPAIQLPAAQAPRAGDAAVAKVAVDAIAAPAIEPPLVREPTPSEPVTAAMTIQPQPSAASQNFEVVVHARIARAHYVYAATKSDSPFTPVTVELTLPDGVEAVGEWQLPPSEKVHGLTKGYRDSILLRRSLKLRPGLAPMNLSVTGELSYQACTDELCWPPGKIPLTATIAFETPTR